jgi:monothiol glutaredoxin
MTPELKTRIDSLVTDNQVLLFMKGNKFFPQCGFSARAVGVLQQLNVPFHTVDVLADADIRQGIKEYGSWPTIPQLYVKGELLGGSDILMEMFESGELAKMVAPAE